MKKKSLIAPALALLFLLSACGGRGVVNGEGERQPAETPLPSVSAPVQPSFGGLDPSDLFPEEEESVDEEQVEQSTPVETAPAESLPEETGEPSPEPAQSEEVKPQSGDGKAYIYLNGDSADCTSNGVKIEGSTVTILDEGTYVLSGTLNGSVIVNADKKDKTQLVLSGVTIHSDNFAAIYVLKADKVTVTLEKGTVNTLSNGGIFTAIDENNVDAVLFSKDDLTLSGAGTLAVASPAAHGIVSKDELIITGGTYEITSAAHGMTGKDNLCIAGGTFAITAGKDGLHSEHDEDAEKGFVQIEGGTFKISAEGDGISASAWLCINGGTFDVVTGGGSVNAEQKTSDNWGGFGGGMPGSPGGGPGGPGGPGGGPGGPPGQTGGEKASAGEDDSTSMKGIKSGGDMTIAGGTFRIDAADDGVHSNSSVSVSGGTFRISTGDDGFHADTGLYVRNGSITVTESYEGLEGLYIEVSGGTMDLTAGDDGLNAAGGADQSGFGGHRGGDAFSARSDSYIAISGGIISIKACGDGIDSNGALTISGGTVTVCGPTNGDTAVLDYDSTGIITGGTFVGTGAYVMARTFSASEGQGVVAVSVGNQAAGTQITLTDGDGNVVLSYAPELPFAIVIFSSPDVVKGETYTITVGNSTGQFPAH